MTILIGGLVIGNCSTASPLSVEPRIGIANGFESDPDLRPVEPRAENNVALTLLAPVRYDLDATHFTLTPAFRYSNARGYSSLASNYFRLDASAQWQGELGSFTVDGQAARDSSLYHGGESIFGVGVRRDTRSAGISWQRTLTERTDAQLDFNWSRVTYDANAASTSLVAYRYLNFTPTLSRAITECDTLSVLGGMGRYNSLSGITRSRDYNLQLGWQRLLSEMWTISATAGYSKSKNSFDFYFGPFYLGTLNSDQKGKVFNASLKRQSERMSLIASLSESFRPTGFAYLSRQDVAELQLIYTWSDRWAFQGRATAYRTREPAFDQTESTRRYFSIESSADWRFSPEWTVSLRVSRVGQRYDAAASNANSTGASIEISRQFYRKDLQ